MAGPILLTVDAQIVAMYVGVAVSGLLAVVALVISLRSLGIQRETARAALLSAEAAQRANWLTEQRMLREATGVTLDAEGSGQLGRTRERRLLPGSADVRWSLERRSRNAFVLRNVGTDVAEEVRIPPEGAAATSRGLPESATVRPQESLEFVMAGTWGSPVPNEILLTWKGCDPAQPLVLPVPR